MTSSGARCIFGRSPCRPSAFNDGTWSKAYDKFYVALKKWNRFQLVETKDEADIVIVLSTQAGEFGGGVATSGGVLVAGTESKFYIRITDARDATPLWSDYTGEGWGLDDPGGFRF
jgi:predicted Zn-dependent protease